MIDLTPSPGAPADFPFLEKTVAKKIGLPKDDMRAWRRAHLKDEEFITHKKALYLSVGAVEKLYAAAEQRAEKSRSAQSSSEGDPVKNAPVKKEPPKPEGLVVIKTNLKNPHMLLACAPGDDAANPKNPLRVRVRSVEGFRLRMPIEGILVPGYEDLYDLVSKYPRKRKPL